MSNTTQKIAHVKLFPTTNLSRIEVIYGNIKDIKVFLTANNTISPYLQIYKQSVLLDFIQLTSGYTVTEFEANQDISQDTRELFLSICRTGRDRDLNQINNLNNLLPAAQSTNNTQSTIQPYTHQAVAQISSNIPNQPDEIIPLIEPIQQIFRDLMRMSNPTTFNTSEIPTVIRNINNALHTIRPDAFNPVDEIPVPASTSMSTQTQVPVPTSNPIPTPTLPTIIPFQLYSPNLLSNQAPISTQFPQLPSFSQMVTDIFHNLPTNHQSTTVEEKTPVQNRILPTTVPMRRMIPAQPRPQQSQLQSNYNNHNNQHVHAQDDIDNSDPPGRFQINTRHNRGQNQHNHQPRREIVINNSELDNQNDQNDQDIIDQNTNDLNNIENVPSHQTTLHQRNQLQYNTIVQLAQTVKRIINTTNVKAPDFTLTSRAGYRKIKNFIHNITKVWLTQNEIDIFVKELLQTNTENNTNTSENKEENDE